MRILELFSGTESISKEFRRRRHETFTIDINPKFNPDLVSDIMELSTEDIINKFSSPDVIWASPPCNCFSVASCYLHWKKVGSDYKPQTERAVASQDLVKHTLALIQEINPSYWFIENPRGMLRKMPFMRGWQRATITYCQYGDTRMKPTDIWGNMLVDLNFKPTCNYGDECHIPAPRGANTGTQGLTGAIQRAIIPPEFGKELCIQIENLFNGRAGARQSTLQGASL